MSTETSPLSPTKNETRAAVCIVRNRRITIYKVPTSKPFHFIEVSVSHYEGRFAAHFQLIEDKNDGWTKSYGGSGVRITLATQPRYNERKLIDLFTTAENHPDFNHALAMVAGKANLNILGEWGQELGAEPERARLAKLQEGKDIQARQVAYCLESWIMPKKPQNAQKFLDAVAALNTERNAQKFDDVPRGVEIERLAYLVGLEKTEAEFNEWLRLISL